MAVKTLRETFVVSVKRWILLIFASRVSNVVYSSTGLSHLKETEASVVIAVRM